MSCDRSLGIGMNSKHLRRMGVTISFFLSAFVLAAAAWGLAATGVELLPGLSPSSWAEQIVYFTGYAVLAGMMADLTRFTVSSLWPLMAKARPKAADQAAHPYAQLYN